MNHVRPSNLLCIVVPGDEELPTCKPGETFELYNVEGKAVPVELVRIEGRRVVFKNVEVH